MVDAITMVTPHNVCYTCGAVFFIDYDITNFLKFLRGMHLKIYEIVQGILYIENNLHAFNFL